MSEKLKLIQGYLNQPPIIIEIPQTTAIVCAIVGVMILLWIGIAVFRK